MNTVKIEPLTLQQIYSAYFLKINCTIDINIDSSHPTVFQFKKLRKCCFMNTLRSRKKACLAQTSIIQRTWENFRIARMRLQKNLINSKLTVPDAGEKKVIKLPAPYAHTQDIWSPKYSVYAKVIRNYKPAGWNSSSFFYALDYFFFSFSSVIIQDSFMKKKTDNRHLSLWMYYRKKIVDPWVSQRLFINLAQFLFTRHLITDSSSYVISHPRGNNAYYAVVCQGLWFLDRFVFRKVRKWKKVQDFYNLSIKNDIREISDLWVMRLIER